MSGEETLLNVRPIEGNGRGDVEDKPSITTKRRSKRRLPEALADSKCHIPGFGSIEVYKGHTVHCRSTYVRHPHGHQHLGRDPCIDFTLGR